MVSQGMPRMNVDELYDFLRSHFPEADGFCVIDQLEEDALDVRLPFRREYLRPGATISGPAMMSLADTAAYLLILAMIGPVALAVTTSLNINFMRKPSPEELRARARMLKLGRQLAVVEVHIHGTSSPALVAQATVTYSIPPR